MTLLLTAGAIGAGIMHFMMKQDDKARQLDEMIDEQQRFSPNSNQYADAATVSGLAHSGHIVRSIPDRDLRGVPMYWLDYGGGSLVRSYAPPGLTKGGGSQFK